MSYTHTLKTDFNNLIAAKLGDTNKVYWTSDEINLYINEALSTFNILAQFWKHRVFIDTVINKNNYDLYEDLLDNVYKIEHPTYQDIINLVNAQLIESLSISTPTSELYTLANIEKYIDKRMDTFLTQTGLNYVLIEIPIQQGIINYNIPSYIVDITRVAFKDDNNQINVLDKEDEQDLGWFNPDFLQNSSNPVFYTRVSDSDNIIKLYPPPINNGTLQIIGIKTRDKTKPIIDDGVVVTEKLLIPKDCYVYIKWGVLADLLAEDGLGQDLSRANYALQRWNEGLTVCKSFTSILNAYINDIPITLDSLSDADDFNPEWPNTNQVLDINNIPTTQIRNLILVGYNLFFTDLIPKAIQSIALDCVVDTPLDSLYIEVREEYLNILVDYILHLSSFKEGFAALQGTSNLLNNFLSLSINHNYRLKQQGITVEYLLKKTKVQEEQNNRGVQLSTQASE